MKWDKSTIFKKDNIVIVNLKKDNIVIVNLKKDNIVIVNFKNIKTNRPKRK